MVAVKKNMFWRGILIVAGAYLAALALSFWIYSSFFSLAASSVLDYLPKNTAILVKFRTTVFLDENPVSQTFVKLAAKEENNSLKLLLNKSGLTKEDFLENLGEEASLAFIPAAEGPQAVLLLEVKNQAAANTLLKRINDQDFKKESRGYRGEITLKSNSKVFFDYLYLDHYLILSQNRNALDLIEKVAADSSSSLSTLRKKMNALGQNEVARFYVKTDDLSAILNGFASKEQLLPFLLSKPEVVLKIEKTAKEKEFALDLTFGEDSRAPDFSPLSLEGLKFLPEESFFLLGGQNLSNEWQNLYTTLGARLPILKSSFGFFQKETRENFQVDLNQDLIARLDSGYFLFLTDEPNLGGGLVLKISNAEFIKDKVKIENVIKRFYARRFPEEKEMILSDGSKAVELSASGDNLVFSGLPNTSFKTLKRKNQNGTEEEISDSLAYGFFNDYLVIVSSKEILSKVDLALKGKNLSARPEFQVLKTEQTKGEYLFADLGKILPGSGFGAASIMIEAVSPAKLQGKLYLK